MTEALTDLPLVELAARIVGQADASVANSEVNIFYLKQPERIPIPVRFANLAPIFQELARRDARKDDQ